MRRALAALGALAMMLCVPTIPRVAAATTVPAFDHVFVVVMENHGYSQVVGSSAAPYTNSLLQSGGLATNYFAVTHPSLPNYLALSGGSTYGIASDCTTCWIGATNIADSVEAAGKTWKAYQESMPSPCFVGDSYPYVQKHDPFIYFNDIRTNASRCQSHVVPYTQLASDLSSTSTTPNFAFITPNICNDMHDCSVQTGDTWLSQQLPAILTSSAFTLQHSLLAVVWDEDDSAGNNQVAMLLLGSGVAPGGTTSAALNHYSLLHTIEDGLGVSTLTANDAGAADATGLFGQALPPPVPPPPASSVVGYFNWFDNATPGMTDNIHLMNPNTVTSSGAVFVAGQSRSFTLNAREETYVTFPRGTIGGPVLVSVSSGPTVLASQRVQYYSTFNEVWAESAAQAATTTYLNWYDKASPGMTNNNLHIVNPGATGASVTISLPGAAAQQLSVPAGGEAYAAFPQGTIGGPVTVSSNQPVLASQRVEYNQSFNEVWAESAAQASTSSYVNWFDKASPGMMNDNIHLLNPNGTATSVTVTAAGASSSISLGPGAESYVTFPAGTIGGPVNVSSTQPVLASQRVEYYSTFNEVWAESASQATAISHVNWYDNASPGMIDDNIHLLNPGAAAATVTVSIPGAPAQNVSVPAGGETYATFPRGTMGGPVTISSSAAVLASQRVEYYSSFNEIWAG